MIYRWCCPNHDCNALNELVSKQLLAQVGCYTCLATAEVLPTENGALYRLASNAKKGTPLGKPMKMPVKEDAA